jgi:transposase
MRKSIDSLSVLAQTIVERNPVTEHIFVFCNRTGDKIKILFWDRNGFWLLYKRLERGRFRWPAYKTSQAISIDRRQLGWLLEGLEIGQARALKAVNSRMVA